MTTLEAIGCQVWRIAGRGLPDLLVYRQRKYFAMEVKTATGTRTQAQRDVPWPIVRSISDALDVINGITVQDV